MHGQYETKLSNERGRRSGLMVEDIADVPQGVKDVAKSLGFGQSLAESCIADLPAEQI